MKFNLAFNKLVGGKGDITREKYGKTVVGMSSGDIVKRKANGAVSSARFSGEDLLAEDWKVLKK